MAVSRMGCCEHSMRAFSSNRLPYHRSRGGDFHAGLVGTFLRVRLRGLAEVQVDLSIPVALVDFRDGDPVRLLTNLREHVSNPVRRFTLGHV